MFICVYLWSGFKITTGSTTGGKASAAPKTGCCRGNGSSGARCLTKKGRKVMPARASEMHTKSLWARCRIVQGASCEGDAKTGVKGRERKREEIKGGERRERDVKSEIIINDSHERRMLDLHEKIDGHEKRDACSLASLRQGVYNPTPFIYLFSSNRNSSLRQFLSYRTRFSRGKNFSLKTATAFTEREKREGSLEENCLGKLVLPETTSGITRLRVQRSRATTNWIRLQRNCREPRDGEIAPYHEIATSRAAIST